MSISRGFITRVDLLTGDTSSSDGPVAGSLLSTCSSEPASSMVSSLAGSSCSSSAGGVAAGAPASALNLSLRLGQVQVAAAFELSLLLVSLAGTLELQH